MSNIMIAFADGDPSTWNQWEAFLRAMDEERPEFQLEVMVAQWRTGYDEKPSMRYGDRIYFVVNRFIRGYVKLLAPVEMTRDMTTILLDVDPRQFEPCGLEWYWGPEFRRSWRYVRFTTACLTPFPDWRTAPGLPVRPALRPAPQLVGV